MVAEVGAPRVGAPRDGALQQGALRFACRPGASDARRWLRVAAAVLGSGACADGAVAPGVLPARPVPADTAFIVPGVAREFRGIWIATVANLDWPSRPSLSSAEQQRELVTLLDRAAGVRANAVIFQVRVNGERLYAATSEPWATSLAGRSDVVPGYDPLQLAIDSARARGLEVHAWFNPFRAGNASDTARLAPSHFARLRPDLRRVPRDRISGAGVGLWFDPGEPDVQDHTISVITQVLQQYDVDAIHLDDFFYPYPNGNGVLRFPDDSTFARCRRGGGGLALDDWRRDNINRFVERLYTEVKRRKPSVAVGISPFGIWRPGHPPGVTGLDAYATLYADSRLWLQRGWVDYLAPQLYWGLGSTGQPFEALLDWWRSQNSAARHVWPGLAAFRVGDGTSSAYLPGEIPAQLLAVRARAGEPGAVLFRARSIFDGPAGLWALLSHGVYADFALPPMAPGVEPGAPPPPTVSVSPDSPGAWRVLIDRPAGSEGTFESPRWWLLRWRTRGSTTGSTTGSTDQVTWHWARRGAEGREWIVPAAVTGARTDAIIVQTVDRAGRLSAPVTWRAP